MIETLKNRFQQNMSRHPHITWDDVEARLNENRDAVETLRQMEATGGEPDVIGMDEETGRFIFCDCSPETPAGRRSLCYDDAALQSRKKISKPALSISPQYRKRIVSAPRYAA